MNSREYKNIVISKISRMRARIDCAPFGAGKERPKEIIFIDDVPCDFFYNLLLTCFESLDI